MAVYNKPFTGLALSTANSTWEYSGLAATIARVLEHYIGGESTTSTVLRYAISRVNAQGTGTAPTAYTPNKMSSTAPASLQTTLYGALSANVAWGTLQETLFDPLVLQTFNTFGGTDRWVPQPGEEIIVGGAAAPAASCSGRSLSGAPTVSGHLIFEEI